MKFGLVTYISHKKINGEYYSYEPYIREMNIWLKFITKFLLLAPQKAGIASSIESAYELSPSEFHEIPEISFINLKETIKAFYYLPFICFRIFKIMRRADHIHLRCPGNVGLLASLIQILFPKKKKTAKYAGNWDPKADQPWSYKMQKMILRNTFLTKNMKVLVYGDWDRQSTNIKPFFTATFSEKEIEEVQEKIFNSCITFLFVGSLVEGKRPMEAVKLFEKLKIHLNGGSECKPSERTLRESKEIRMEIFGEGPLRKSLENYSKSKRLEEIIFRGNCSLNELKEAYQSAHFIILPSQSEGWPKAIAEGMFFGCIPIASQVSCVPWMLNYGERGILLNRKSPNLNTSKHEPESPNDRVGEIELISALLKDSKQMEKISSKAKTWSQQYTLEKLEKAIHDVIAQC